MKLHGEEGIVLRFVVVGRGGFAVVGVVGDLNDALLWMNVMFVKSLPLAGRVNRANWFAEPASVCGEPKFGGSSPRVDCWPLSARSNPPPPRIGA